MTSDPKDADDQLEAMEEKNTELDDQRKIEVDSASLTPDLQNNYEYITGLKLTLVLSAITGTYFLIMLDNTILATAIPHITDEFDSLLAVGWYASTYQLVCSAFQPLGGKIYSKLSSKKAFITYIILFEIGSVLCGAASSSTMLIVGRGIAGMGGSGLLNGGLIILNSCVPPHRQPALMGIITGIGQLGIAAGPLLGGTLTEYATWRWCFYINLPIGLTFATALTFIHIPDHIPKPGLIDIKSSIIGLDLLGLILFVPAAIQFFIAIQFGGNQFAWDSSQVIGLICGSGVTFIIWLLWNFHQGDNAMAPLSVIKQRVVWSSCIAASFLAATMFITAYYLPIYFQGVLGHSPFIGGVDILPNILAQLITAIIAGTMIQKIGYYTPFLLSGAILNSIGCGLLSLLTPSTATGRWIGFQIIFGAGRGVANLVPFLSVQNSLSKAQIPAAMSMLVFLQGFTSAVMIVLSQTVFTKSLIELVPQYAPGVTPKSIIDAGITTVRKVVAPEQVAGVILAYSKSLQRVWHFCAGLATVSFFVDGNDEPRTNTTHTLLIAPVAERVTLEAIRASNGRVASELPAGLVAVFVGATSGIGETSVKQFAKYASKPRIYFVGRREDCGRRIETELKTLNPDGEYHYLKCDASLLKNVDQLCHQIKSKEAAINLLFVTIGTLITGKQTEEGLYYTSALTYYARMRVIADLVPLLKKATSLRRVVTVFAGSKESKIYTDDFPGQSLNIVSYRGHTVSMITLGLEAIAKQAPEISFIHDYPGFVETGMSREIKGPFPSIISLIFKPIMFFLKIPIDEVGERHTFFATSARFPSVSGEADGLTLDNGVETATGTDGKIGGGVYSIDYEAQGTDPKVQKLLSQFREDGTAEKAWNHTQKEFLRIVGSPAI